jgi:hypothetical protein
MRGPLPIVVGVTGHRDIEEHAIPALEAQVAAIFVELTNRYRNTPLLLLSPLAAGADRIVARVAERFAIPVVAPLPLEVPEYEKDFSADELVKFRELLPRVYCSYFVGYVPGNDAAAVAPNGPARNLQYAQVGSYVVRNSQVLIALWNGLDSGGVGGTAQVVRFKLEGIPPAFGPNRRPIDPPDVGPVRHIITPRDDADLVRLGDSACRTVLVPPVRVSTGSPEKPHERARKVADETFRNLDRFNRRAAAIGVTSKQLSATVLRDTADKLSMRYRNWTAWTIKSLFVLAFLTAFCFEWFAHREGHPWWAVAADLVLSAMGLGLFFVARGWRWQDSFQDYRAIAEALRIQKQWQSAAIDETVADHYLQQHRGELDWIRNAIRTCRILDHAVRPAPPAPLADRAKALEDACRAWIGGAAGDNGQIEFFESRIARNKGRERIVTWVTGSMLSISIVLTVVALLAKTIHAPALAWFIEPEDHFAALIIAIALTAVFAALAKGYANLRVYSEQRKQYERMLGVFRYAKAELAKAFGHAPFEEADYDAARRIVVNLGDEALGENAAWVMLHRERQMEYPR